MNFFLLRLLSYVDNSVVSSYSLQRVGITKFLQSQSVNKYLLSATMCQAQFLHGESGPLPPSSLYFKGMRFEWQRGNHSPSF